MAFIPVPQCISLSFEFLLGGQTVVVTLSVRSAAPVTEVECANAADAGADWVIAELLPHLSDNLSFQNVKAYSLDSSSAPVATLSLPPGTNGDILTPANANNVAGVISLRTANRGRSGRGRMYIPGIPAAANVNPATMNSTTQSGLLDAASQLGTYFSPGGFTPGVISKYTGGAPRVTGLFQSLDTAIVDNRYDSQRRRLAGRGI